MTGVRVVELFLAGSAGGGKSYGAEFRVSEGRSFRPLSVIAGPSLTGKTSIVDYIRYCLGEKEYPQHEELVTAGRAALLEVEVAGQPTGSGRSTTGSPSSFASVWDSTLGGLDSAHELRVGTEPPSDPDGLSQMVLAACNLDGIELPDSGVKEETATQRLSIRDVFNVVFFPNERLDNNNLVFEQSHHMVRQKFRQTIDAMFGVHDNEQAVLTSRYQAAQAAAKTAESRAITLRQVAEQDHPQGADQLAKDLDESRSQIENLKEELAALDIQQRTTQEASVDLRSQLVEAEQQAKDARVRVRDRRSLIARLDALRGQYADDKRKLNFLLDAERLFDPLHVVVCPACLSQLETPPKLEDGECSLCHSEINGSGELSEDEQSVEDNSSVVLERELRAVGRRLNSLNEYVERLNLHLRVLEDESAAADSQAEAAAVAVDAVTESPSPWLALRDSLTQRLSDARLTAQKARTGTNAWSRVADAEEKHARLREHAQEINAQRKAQTERPSRKAVIDDLSGRFGEILSDLGYPKLENPYIADDLVPHVRNQSYVKASSGGKVVIALAWGLALWEVAHEQNANAPGLLVLDSPQKNLGHDSKPGDEDFADARLVDNFYSHVKTWLGGEGEGAQLIVVDNSPPPSVDPQDVVVEYTRDPNRPPYGLIPEATG